VWVPKAEANLIVHVALFEACTQVQLALTATSYAFQLFLVAKSLAVAIGAPDRLLPPASHSTGELSAVPEHTKADGGCNACQVFVAAKSLAVAISALNCLLLPGRHSTCEPSAVPEHSEVGGGCNACQLFLAAKSLAVAIGTPDCWLPPASHSTGELSAVSLQAKAKGTALAALPLQVTLCVPLFLAASSLTVAVGAPDRLLPPASHCAGNVLLRR
jgi:hypothetical protein